MPHPAITRDPRPATAIEALRAARFHVRRKGYDIAEVDRLLQRCLQTLERLAAANETEPTPDGDGDGKRERAWRTFWEDEGSHAARADDDEVAALIAAAYLPTRRKGYDQGEVDALLAGLATILAGPIPAAGAAPAVVPAAPAAPEADAGAADRAGAAPIADASLLAHESEAEASSVAPAGGRFTVPLPPPPPPAAVPPAPTPAPVAAPAPVKAVARVETAAPVGWTARQGLEDQLVRQVVDASLQSAHELADGPGVRREAERLLEELQETRLAEIGEKVERECRDLREAAVDQCATIVSDARSEADRMLAAVARRVEERLEQVRIDAAEELERIVAEERRGLAQAAAAAAPDASVGAALGLGPTTRGSHAHPLVFAEGDRDDPAPRTDPAPARARADLPRRPLVDLPFATRSWDLASVDRPAAWDPSSYPHEGAPTVGGASDVEECGS